MHEVDMENSESERGVADPDLKLEGEVSHIDMSGGSKGSS
jgi:hypothetical protein